MPSPRSPRMLSCFVSMVLYLLILWVVGFATQDSTRFIGAALAGDTPQAAGDKRGPGDGAGKQAEAAPAKTRGKLSVSGYSFIPTDKDWHIDQPGFSGEVEFELDRDDRRTPWSDRLPGWRGVAKIDMKNGYRLEVNVRHLWGELVGDFVHEKKGVSLDVFFYHEKQLLSHQAVTHWSDKGPVEAKAHVIDVPYVELLRSNGFDLPSEVDGYSQDFRFWAALRDGLNKRDGKISFESLSGFLKALNRKNNLMMPHVTVSCRVNKP